MRSPTGDPARGAARRLSVLVVEDHASTRAAMRLLLGRQQMEVVAVGTVQEARQEAEKRAFDIVISDLGLPDGGGQSMLLELRAMHPRIKAIAVTGRPRGDTAPGFESDAFDARLTKPINFDLLRETIDRVKEGQG